MGYSVRHEEKFIVKNRVGVTPVMEVVDMGHEERKGWWSMEEEEERRPVVEKKVHHQIQKLRAEDSKLGVDIKEVLVSGKYRVVGGGDDDDQHIASVVLFSRPSVLPASPLSHKTHSSQACFLNQ